jgi:hypothetical protein
MLANAPNALIGSQYYIPNNTSRIRNHGHSGEKVSNSFTSATINTSYALNWGIGSQQKVTIITVSIQLAQNTTIEPRVEVTFIKLLVALYSIMLMDSIFMACAPSDQVTGLHV